MASKMLPTVLSAAIGLRNSSDMYFRKLESLSFAAIERKTSAI
jgi:hypothetical protein